MIWKEEIYFLPKNKTFNWTYITHFSIIFINFDAYKANFIRLRRNELRRKNKMILEVDFVY